MTTSCAQSRDGVDYDATAEDELRAVHAARQKIRENRFDGPTAGLARGFVQANLMILPADFAFDFLRYCQANPKPCPLLASSEPGNPVIASLGHDIDVRTDAPAYRVFRDGEPAEERNDITDLWRDDLVAFAIGCSFSFEEALMSEGIALRHVEQGRNVAMYKTSIDTTPAGRFAGKLVVSMRPLRPADAIRAIQICTRFPAVHGAPIHIGVPEQIGITSLESPDFGDTPSVRADELPVFWACGVTPQVAVMQARPPLAISHSPGCMLITDIANARLAAF